MEKKPWETPQLIVLVRSKPEEAVLGVCKGVPTEGPNNSDFYCIQGVFPCSACFFEVNR